MNWAGVILLVALSACAPNSFQLAALKTDVETLRTQVKRLDDQVRHHRLLEDALNKTDKAILFVGRHGLKRLIASKLPAHLRGEDLNRRHVKGMIIVDRVTDIDFDAAGRVTLSIAFKAENIVVDLRHVPMAGETASFRFSRALQSGGHISLQFVPTMTGDGSTIELNGRCTGIRLNHHDDLIYRRHLIQLLNLTFFTAPWRVTIPQQLANTSTMFGRSELGWFWFSGDRVGQN